MFDTAPAGFVDWMYWLSRAVNWSGQRDIYIDIETLFDIQNVEEKCEQVTHRNTWNLSGVRLL